MFTLEWIGEWARNGSFNTVIYYEDISSTIGLIFRFAGSFIAVAAAVYYFSRGLPLKAKAYGVLRWIVLFEGLYWLSLLTSAVESDRGVLLLSLRNQPLNVVVNSLVTNAIPSIVESIALPIVLFMLAYALNPNKPERKAVKWSLITGVVYIVVFWLLNLAMWILAWNQKGTTYITGNPENFVSFVVTVFGLLALVLYTAHYTWKMRLAESWLDLNPKIAGAIILALGLYFFWNYFSAILFLNQYSWSVWYSWFLGHNLDLWVMSLVLVGLPMLFLKKPSQEHVSA